MNSYYGFLRKKVVSTLVGSSGTERAVAGKVAKMSAQVRVPKIPTAKKVIAGGVGHPLYIANRNPESSRKTTRQFVRLLKFASIADLTRSEGVLGVGQYSRYLRSLVFSSGLGKSVSVEGATPAGDVQAFFGFLAGNSERLLGSVDMSGLEAVECVAADGIAQLNMQALKDIKAVFAGLGEKLGKTRAVFQALYMCYQESKQSPEVLKDLQARLARTLFGSDSPKVQATLGLAIRYYETLFVAPEAGGGSYAGPPLLTEYSDFSRFSVAEKFQSLGLLLNAAKLPALAVTTLATIHQVTDLTATLGEYARGDALDCLDLPSLRAYSQEALVDAIADLLISLGVEKAFDATKEGNVDNAKLFAPFSRRGTRFLPSNVFVVLQRSGLTPPILNAIAAVLVGKAAGFSDPAAEAFLVQAMSVSVASVGRYPVPAEFALKSLAFEAAIVEVPVPEVDFDLDAAISHEANGIEMMIAMTKHVLLSLPEAAYATRLAELKAGYNAHLLIEPTERLTASLAELDSDQLDLLAAWVIGEHGIAATAIPAAADGTVFADADVPVKRAMISGVVSGNVAEIGLVTAQATSIKETADTLGAKKIALNTRLGELDADELNALADEIATAEADGGLGIVKADTFDALATGAKIDALAAVLLTEAQLDATEVIVERMVLRKVFLALPPVRLAEFRDALNGAPQAGFNPLAELTEDGDMAAHSATVLASFTTVALGDRAAAYKHAQEVVLNLLSASVRAGLGTLSDAQVSALGLGLNGAGLVGYGSIDSFDGFTSPDQKVGRIGAEIGKIGLLTQQVEVYKHLAAQAAAVKTADDALQAVLAVSSKQELVALWPLIGITDEIATVFTDLAAATDTGIAAAMFERRPAGLVALTAAIATAKDSYFDNVFTPFLQLFDTGELGRLIALPAVRDIPGLVLAAPADETIEAAAAAIVSGARALSGAQMQEAVSVIFAQANRIYLETLLADFSEADFAALRAALLSLTVVAESAVGDIAAARVAVFAALDRDGDSNLIRIAYGKAVEQAEPIQQARNVARLASLMDEDTFTEPVFEAFVAFVQAGIDPGPGLGINLDNDGSTFASLGTMAEKKARVVAKLGENLASAGSAFRCAESLLGDLEEVTTNLARFTEPMLDALAVHVQAETDADPVGLGISLDTGSLYTDLGSVDAKRARILEGLGVVDAGLALPKVQEILQAVFTEQAALKAAQVARILAEIGVREGSATRYVALAGEQVTVSQLERLAAYVVAGRGEDFSGLGISLDGEVADTDFAGLGFGPRKLRMATVLGAHDSLEDLTAVADKIEQMKASDVVRAERRAAQALLQHRLCCYGLPASAIVVLVVFLVVYREMVQAWLNTRGLGE
jgi:hypothetical protein